MKEEKCLLVLFEDGCLNIFCGTYGHRKSHYQKGAKFFAVDDNTTAIEITEWRGGRISERVGVKFKEINLPE